MAKKLLIITYRFTNPPLGGAEVYMFELIKGLDEIGDFDITVAYLDSYDIENKYHFSINATHNMKQLSHDFQNVTFKKFKYDELNDNDKLENSRLLMKNWMEEFLNSARKFLHYYNKSILLGGWNFPEKTDVSSQIWSSSVSEIYLTNVNSILIRGYSPSEKIISFKMNNNTIEEKSVNGVFEIKLPILKSGILTIECTEEYIGEDVRPLGVLINSIVLDSYDLDLSYCYRDFLKDNYLSEYVDELVYIASKRDEKFDTIFQKTRGLNSIELETYLDSKVKDFDLLLGHSVPFATTPITSKFALKYNKPYVLLPHFHFDDEFYHWSSYYKAFENANNVFASPSVSINTFYNKLNIKTAEVPGGGINKDEYNNIDSKEFLKLYKSDKPYFFVLGRKSGAKNYASIIEAIDKVNQQEHICNLVMIGRDEDGVKIDSKYIYYLGEQHRDVVLGALKECYGLVTMSESESFGIVIVEAWMLKKPVIINEKCPAFVELVEDKVNGLYANKTSLKAKIEHMLNDVKMANKLGENGFSLTENYTWNGISELFNKEILRLLG